MKNLLTILFLCFMVCNTAKAKECERSPYKIDKFSKTHKSVLSKIKLLKKWKDCHGSLTYKNGSKYVGGFKNGRFSGQGTFTWKKGKFAGEKYVGEFLKGKKNGLGSYTFSNGDIDHGIWKKGKLIKRIQISKKKLKFDETKEAKLHKKKNYSK